MPFSQPRYIECPTCNGEGVVERNIVRDGIEMDVMVECNFCEGSGKVLDEKLNDEEP